MEGCEVGCGARPRRPYLSHGGAALPPQLPQRFIGAARLGPAGDGGAGVGGWGGGGGRRLLPGFAKY